MPTIFCVGRNYAAHVREMEGQVVPDDEPVFFLKPWAALVLPPASIHLPPGAAEVHHEAEIVVRVGSGPIAEAIALGLDLTDRPRQAEAKRRGHPWTAAKGFRGSAPVGPFVPVADAPPLDALRFTLHVGDDLRQRGDTALLLRPVPVLLEALDALFGLTPGDLVFTGTPEGVGPIRAGDRLRLELEGVPAAATTFDVR